MAGLSSSGSVIPNQHRSASTMDPRRTKGPGDPNSLSRGVMARSATARRPGAKSPSPPAPELEEDGLVISNRQQDSGGLNFLDEEDIDNADVDGIMEDFNKEEEEMLLIDSRLLHKDFIVKQFSLAHVSFRKVRFHARTHTHTHTHAHTHTHMHTHTHTSLQSAVLVCLLGWEDGVYSLPGVSAQVLEVSGDTEGEGSGREGGREGESSVFTILSVYSTLGRQLIYFRRC